MGIIRNRRIDGNPWRHAPEGAHAELAATHGPITVALADWLRHRDALIGRRAPTGVRLRAADDAGVLVEHLHVIPMIAFEFASFAEGRAYSQARMLRERHGYRGEIRAMGDVSRDRLAFMERCGFNAFELRSGDRPDEALRALDEISDVYQPAADARQAIAARRV